MTVRCQRVTQRLEEPAQEWFSSLARKYGYPCLERQFLLGKVWLRFASAGERASEHLGYPNAQEGRRYIGTVIDVLITRRLACPPRSFPDESNRVYIEQQCRRTSIFRDLRVENVGRAE